MRLEGAGRSEKKVTMTIANYTGIGNTKVLLTLVVYTLVQLSFSSDSRIIVSAFQLRLPVPIFRRHRRCRRCHHHHYAETGSISTSLLHAFPLSSTISSSSSLSGGRSSPVIGFIDAVNNNNIDKAMTYVAVDTATHQNDVEFQYYTDTDYPNAWRNRNELERNLRLREDVMNTNNINSNTNNNELIIIDHDIYDAETKKSGIAFHIRNRKKMTDNNNNDRKGAAFFELNEDGLIYKAFIVKESNSFLDKSGEKSLKILKLASDIISITSPSSSPTSENILSSEDTNITSTTQLSSSSLSSSLSLPEIYFNGWNQRDMSKAVSVFAQDVKYDDTAFPKPFTGMVALKKHLNLCAESMPLSFTFVVDDKIDIGNKAMVLWHVESKSKELPYTRGCSWYLIENNKITSGTDLKEPAVVKSGGVTLFFDSVLSKLQDEPGRIVPIIVWTTYCYVVFFSEWFYGLPAQSFELRTWIEVKNLSINFFLVSPILGLPFSPVVHPGLEGIFNLLLSWAALFVGFLSDDRRRKPNILPMLPIVIGMQFLTSAFLLPYLATRSKEDKDHEGSWKRSTIEDVSAVTRVVAENKLFPVMMGLVGSGSICWGLFARVDEFGTFSARYSSLVDLLRIDRVGSSFLVDLAIFGFFQGWLVDDDAKRRGMESNSPLIVAAKFVPFFGLVSYLVFRSKLISSTIDDDESS